MDFGPFIIISLLYGLLAIRCVWQLAHSWRETFDRRFTHADRMLVDQAAFFVLVPISVALHEVGHAVTIKLLGGTVEGWGYYGFAGWVGFIPSQFTAPERILIAAAGTIVNIVLAAAATGLVFFKRPPMRAAFNELLLQFSFISLLNALVLYPLLDLLTGMEGDWSQMYFGGVPALSAFIFAVQVGIIALMLWMWKSSGMHARIAALTGGAPGGGLTPIRHIGSAGRAATPANPANPVQAALADAAERVASGWPEPVESGIQQRHDGPMLVLSWTAGGARRAVLALARPDAILLTGVAHWSGGATPSTQPLGQERTPIDVDRLTLALRIAMERVDAWRPAASAVPYPGPVG
ncbi:MAG TPA: hypothetical protein VFI22_19415 [Thermomicrobiales bacterium]|nr:hypothetical protein [Thermomicrobiales bacterium]